MKKYLILFLSLLPVYYISQITDVKADTSSSLAKISGFDVNKAVVPVEKIHQIPELSFKEAKTSADSAVLADSYVEVTERFIRFDPELISECFPETITIDHLENTIVDYDSFIPILLQLVKEQQELINELNIRISELEKQ